jgi:hypothetical protein
LHIICKLMGGVLSMEIFPRYFSIKLKLR